MGRLRGVMQVGSMDYLEYIAKAEILAALCGGADPEGDGRDLTCGISLSC